MSVSLNRARTVAIFDMNGTMINDGRFHRNAWMSYCQKKGHATITPDIYSRHIAGRNNRDILTFFLGRQPDPDELHLLGREKEAIYRDSYRPFLAEVPGLTVFLDQLKKAGIPRVLATSAGKENIDFVLDGLNLRRFFSQIIGGDGIKNGKPAPDIFLKAAEVAGKAPQDCVVFEDAFSGFKAALSAGSKCVGLITNLTEEQIIAAGVDLAIKDFTQISVSILDSLFVKKG
ncbi:MAG: HAD-IA family hydrolase [Candidatus Saganbacteria bacterium]|nr:HAD-IA family hydrolase [Candidatus Saganbacteria bacterium]